MKWINSNNFLSNILCGIISSLVSIPITAIIKIILDRFTPNALSIPLFYTMLALVLISLFLFIKLLFIRKSLSEFHNYINPLEVSKEIKAIYPDQNALTDVLVDLLPRARQVDILDLRGFYYTQQDSDLFRIISISSKTEYRILLSEPNSDNTNYRANHIPNKSVASLKNEIQVSISTISNLNKSNVKLKLYRMHNITRLIFIDNELFLTPFRNGGFLTHAPTFRIPSDGALFKCYQDYFSEIWNNRSNNISSK